MKVYSIGREVGCDIVINDTTDVISRRHATLNVDSMGKMTITDTSRNGTYVNGIRINANVPVPVSRKDNVSFAHVARLDWSLVQSPVTPMRYVIIGVVAVAIVVCGVVGYNSWGGGDSDMPIQPTVTTAADTVKSDKDKEASIRKAVEDSIKHRQDSIKRQDSIRNAQKVNKPANNNGGQGKKAQDDKAKQDSTKTRRLGN